MKRVMISALAASALFAAVGTVRTAEAFPAGKVQAPAAGSMVTDVGRGGQEADTVAAMEVDTVVVMAEVTDTALDTAEVVTDTAPDTAGAAGAGTAMARGSVSTALRSWATAPTTTAAEATAKGAAGCAAAPRRRVAATGGRATKNASMTTIN